MRWACGCECDHEARILFSCASSRPASSSLFRASARRRSRQRLAARVDERLLDSEGRRLLGDVRRRHGRAAGTREGVGDAARSRSRRRSSSARSDARGQRLLARRLGRRHVHLRRRALLRQHREPAPQPTGLLDDADDDRPRLLARRADGGIFTFGDARFYGSTGDHRLEAADHRHHDEPVRARLPHGRAGRRRSSASATCRSTAASPASAFTSTMSSGWRRRRRTRATGSCGAAAQVYTFGDAARLRQLHGVALRPGRGHLLEPDGAGLPARHASGATIPYGTAPGGDRIDAAGSTGVLLADHVRCRISTTRPTTKRCSTRAARSGAAPTARHRSASTTDAGSGCSATRTRARPTPRRCCPATPSYATASRSNRATAWSSGSAATIRGSATSLLETDPIASGTGRWTASSTSNAGVVLVSAMQQ